jgi:peptide alpha-N-acetyltransferase
MLDKGVPSTFANLKHLYSDSSKKEILPALVEKYLKDGGDVTNAEPKREGDASKGASAAYYFLAQHYNYYLSRDLDKSLEYIEKAIELEPKSVDFHLTKARIWKHYGNTEKASEIMEQARALDTRDRHINTKSAKYQLRNNDNEAAIKTVGLFTKAETPGGPLADLHDMQCMWFLTEDGKSHARQKSFGLALKRFTSIYNIFDVWQEDQFDFHAFSLRKGQIRAYIEMIRWEDHLREHPFYTQAALGAIDIYLKIFDAPHTNGTDGTDANGDDAAERKKAAKKARKAAQKAEQDAAAKKNEQPNKPNPEGETKKVDDDPNGVKLAATADPLLDATKFLGPLLQFSPKMIESHAAGFEVYIRRSKFSCFTFDFWCINFMIEKHLLALKSLLAAAALDRSHPTVHEQIIRFKLALDADSSTIPEKSLEVIKSEFTLLPASVKLSNYNDEYLKNNRNSVKGTLAALKVRRLLQEGEKANVEKEVVKVLDLPEITLEDAQEVLELLTTWRSAEVESFKSKAATKWPKATVFSKA